MKGVNHSKKHVTFVRRNILWYYMPQYYHQNSPALYPIYLQVPQYIRLYFLLSLTITCK